MRLIQFHLFKFRAKVKEMKILYIIIFFMVYLANIGNAGAQPSDITFKHLTIDDGLSQNAVFAVLQDNQGFMWFGTKDGLNRYDGYAFKIFQNSPFDSTSLSSSYITTLFEDSRGWLWIGTADGGLNRLDRDKETFIRYVHNPADTGSLSSNEITAIAEDGKGNIWIGTRDGGINKLSISEAGASDTSFTRYSHSPENSNSLSNNSVNALYFDRTGIAWIGTDVGLDKMIIRKENSFFYHFPIRTKNKKAPSIPKDNSVTAIFEDSRGAFWLGTPSGLSRFNRNSGKYVNYPHHYQIFRYGWGTVTDILEDRAGYFWLATPGGLMHFNPANSTYFYVKHNPFNLKGFSDNSTTSLYQDRSRILWFGTSGYGLNIYDPKANRFKTLRRARDASSRIAGFSVRSILEDNEGDVWVSTGVVYKWNRKSGELRSFETNSNQLNDFGNTGAWSMIQDRRNNIWLATHQGLYRYNPRSKLVRQYKFNPADTLGLREKIVYSVFVDRTGNIWIATDSYFSKLVDENRGRFIHYRYNFDSPGAGLAAPTIFQDNRGRFWLGTQNGLLRFNPKTGSFIAYRNDPRIPGSISNNVVRSICADPNNPSRFLWLGTHGGGLNRFNMDTETFTHYTTKEGLPNNVVYGILSDNIGLLWMSTNRGLSRFNPSTGEFHNFDAGDGLQSNEFNTGAYFKSRSGEMFFGGIDGLNYFYPRRIVNNPYIPNVVITGLRIFNREVTPYSHPKLLQAVISRSREITLSYRQNVVTFEFAALDYSGASRNQYAYKLEGFNENWILLGKVRTTTFTNLPSGDYVLRVRGSNNDGVWNEQGASLVIHVTPPPWRTWWAYLFYTLVILGALYGIRRYELNRVRLKNHLKVEQIEGEKLRELDQMKSRFFANLSHEFRTPLTLILGQIDRVITDASEEKERRRLEVALRNARRLLRLINQLLDLSKLEAGSMTFKAERQNIIPFLKNLIFSFESLAEQKNITLQFHCKYNWVELDYEADKLEKVFYNLLSNAFKFTPQGGEITVEVRSGKWEVNGSARSETVHPASHFVDIMVTDTGGGIVPEQIPHIFNRFYQGDSSSTREKEGSGIGLALVKELVELHNGKITVKSEINRRTSFIVRLPVCDPPVVIPETKVSRDRVTPFAEDDGRQTISDPLNWVEEQDAIPVSAAQDKELLTKNSTIVLVVEDHPDVRKYICEQLGETYRVAEAADGEEGVALALEFIPDLIIADIMMPRMDGYRMCTVLKQDEKTCHIPIIMLTAKAGMEDKIEGLETGADDYLLKPFSARELTVRVKNLINMRRKLRERFREITVVKPAEVTAIPIEQAFLAKVFHAVATHLGEEQFDVPSLAGMVGMSVSQLNRKLGALVDQSAGKLIRSFRLKRAADLLKQNAGTVAEICYEVGFGDQANFTRAFKKQFGMAPGAYRKENQM